MSSKKPPLHPRTAKYRREAIQGFITASIAALTGPLFGAITIITWLVLDEPQIATAIAILGIPTWFLFLDFHREFLDARKNWNNYKEILDRQKWDTYQAENECIQRIVKEQGWEQ